MTSSFNPYAESYDPTSAWDASWGAYDGFDMTDPTDPMQAYYSDPSTMQTLPTELEQLRAAVQEERRVGLAMIETQWQQLLTEKEAYTRRQSQDKFKAQRDALLFGNKTSSSGQIG